ncbi:glycosyltransferase family 2 protein [Roseibium sp. MMSF_3412]|uniref:glycosyltransferase family 2 protein n=1 Tax=Roseibium sp. MMSF_3412 TaxID=3046712 RepID=UPI00273D37EA|nr:glycosyltransferase [Roseibium sp. MMSF_3412]
MKEPVSVVITSYNRVELLRECILQIQSQSRPCEVIVCDDGSTDGSVEMVRAEFPEVVLVSNETGSPRWVVTQMDLGYRKASHRLILSIDEDLIVPDSETVDWLCSFFEDASVGIVAMPFVDVLRDERVQNASKTRGQVNQRHCHIGAGAMIDGQKYLEVGGYSLWLENYREEAELGLKMFDAGYKVIVPPPEHVARHLRRQGGLSEVASFRSARNDVLFYWRYTPGRMWPIYVTATILRNLVDGFKERTVAARIRGLFAALPHSLRHSIARQPVTTQAFAKFRALKSTGPQPVEKFT